MKKAFITGLIVLLPISVTFLLISFVLHLFTDPFLEIVSSFLSSFKDSFPLFSSENFIHFLATVIIIILFCLVIVLLGILGKWFFLRSFINWINSLLLKIPIFKTLYHTLKDLISSVFSLDEKRAFQYPVMVNFPSSSSSAIGFASGSVPVQCQNLIKDELIAVFVPTIHPITGFLIFIPKKDVYNIKMTSEETFKFTISCGVITPESKKKEEKA